MPFGIVHPPQLHIKCSLYVCSRVQGSQIFKWNSIILICSKVVAFLVILLSPRGPHVVPHIIPIAPTRSPWLWSPLSPAHVVPMVPTSSPSSPHHLEGPHIISNPPDTHPSPPSGWGAQISKNAIKFELIKIF